MACCVIAAFLVAQLVAMLRRWGIFWGVVRARPDEQGAATLFAWMRGWLARPQARAAVTLAVVLEITAVGAWIYSAHGAHLYRLVDQQWARIHGERVLYVGYCTPDGGDRYVRLVLDPPTRVGDTRRG